MIMDPDYARVFTKARCAAKHNGYAITLHGSFTRDLDILAVPWTDKAVDPKRLATIIVAATGLTFQDETPYAKAHGRLAWTFLFPEFGDPRFVDFSVVPMHKNHPIVKHCLSEGTLSVMKMSKIMRCNIEDITDDM